MARNFHRKDRLSALTEINVTPLIDLAFALLIIFMITTPLLEQTIALNLPIETSKQQTEDIDDFQSLSIDAAGRHFWGSQEVSLERLGVLLDQIAQEPSVPVLSIRADAKLPYQRIVTLIDMIKQRNLSKISLDTKVD